MAAITPSPRRRGTPPQWAGAVGMALGTSLGAAACWLLAHAF